MAQSEADGWAGEIADLARESGVDIIGFASMAGLESLLHASIRESAAMLPYAVSLAYRLSDSIVDQIADSPTLIYKHHYKTVYGADCSCDSCFAER
jgi:hypothetical protein